MRETKTREKESVEVRKKKEKDREGKRKMGEKTGEKVEAKLYLAIVYHLPVPAQNNAFFKDIIQIFMDDRIVLMEGGESQSDREGKGERYLEQKRAAIEIELREQVVDIW